MQAAVISLLAGDLFRGTPINRSLRAFKIVYYLWGLFNPRRAGGLAAPAPLGQGRGPRRKLDVVDVMHSWCKLCRQVSTYHHGELRPALLRAAAKILEKEGATPSRCATSRAAPASRTTPRTATSLIGRRCWPRLPRKASRCSRPRSKVRPWREQAMAYVRFGLTHPQRPPEFER